MSQECGPFGEEGSNDGLAQRFKALAGFGFGELADEPCSFYAPTASTRNSKKRLSGRDLAAPVLGASVIATIAHPSVL